MKYYMLIFTFILISFYINSTNSYDHKNTITFDDTNVISLIGEIDGENTDLLLYEINKNIHSDNEIYVYIDTHGGSVYHGLKIVDEIRKYNISCIAQNAFSMGFAILQSCYKRFITETSRLMQHQMSYVINGNHEQVLQHIKLMEQIDHYINNMQSNRIGMNLTYFKTLVSNDWWLFGKNAIDMNCADEIVNVKCSQNLTNTYYQENKKIYSKCPLINGPIS